MGAIWKFLRLFDADGTPGDPPPDATADADVDPLEAAEAWLKTQPEDVQKNFKEKNASLFTALRAEREANKTNKEASKKLAELEKLQADKAKADMTEAERLKAEVQERDQKLAEKDELLAKHEAEKSFNVAVEELKIVFFDETARKDAFALMDIKNPAGFKKALKEKVTERPYLLKTVTNPDLDADKNKQKTPAGELTDAEKVALAQRFRIPITK